MAGRPGSRFARATAFHGLPYRVLQTVDDFPATRGDLKEEKSRFHREYNEIEAMARMADRPVAISWMDRMFAPTQSPWLGAAALQGAQRGVAVRLACAPHGVGMLLSSDATKNLLFAFPGYRENMPPSTAERAKRMRNSERRARVLTEPPLRLSVPGSSMPPMMGLVIAQFGQWSMEMFPCFVVPRGASDSSSCCATRELPSRSLTSRCGEVFWRLSDGRNKRLAAAALRCLCSRTSIVSPSRSAARHG